MIHVPVNSLIRAAQYGWRVNAASARNMVATVLKQDVHNGMPTE